MKKFLVISLGSIFVVAGAGYFGLWITSAPRDWALKGRFERIQVGMSKQEVEAIFGCPAESSSEITGSPGAGQKTIQEQLHSWSGKHDEIVSILVDERGRVRSKSFSTAEDRAAYFHSPEKESFLNKVRRWLGIAV